jgi:hypothetical protein
VGAVGLRAGDVVGVVLVSRAEISSHAEKAERYGPGPDDLYEEKLRRCKKHGHRDFAYETADGREGLECDRCQRRMEEVL